MKSEIGPDSLQHIPLSEPMGLIGGAVAEWSKALLQREKITENQEISGAPLSLGKQIKLMSFNQYW